MKGNNEQGKILGKQTAEVLGDWLYPNVTSGSGGGWTDDRKFFVVKYQATDSLEQIRKYYWKLCRPDKPDYWGDFGDGGFMMSEKPRIFYQNGPPMMVVHVTAERTIFIVAVRDTSANQIELCITFDAH
jgi:hypothetical protein